MASTTQENRPVRVYSALPDNALIFGSMNGRERLSAPFEYELMLFSEDADLDLAGLVGTDLTVELDLPDGSFRHFHGYVAGCAHAPGEGTLAGYEVSLRPWLWFLTRTADCRIFQEVPVPEIVREIFAEAGFTDIDDELTESYRVWEFCVQYRETDFNFVSRLMEQEGIHYYFRHDRGLHRLVLADADSAHRTQPSYEEVPLIAPGNEQRRSRDHLSDWLTRRRLRPGRFAVRDFNFETPRDDLGLASPSAIDGASGDLEIYDYPGEYAKRAAGEVRARQLREESDAQHEIAQGSGNAHGLLVGNVFTLVDAERQRDNREYLLIAAEFSFAYTRYRSGDEDDLGFHTRIEAIASNVPYRAPRRTPKPLVQGPQTAMVVGPAGEEIWTDRFGRVKLQFHWDRYGQSDENSSCWVRVSQTWAGAGWGAMHVPRIGQEVIVEFLEGDPDRPIVTGRVYNGDNGVPYPLPASATQSGIKSRSSPGGGGANFNEIRMEDKTGSEELYIHAEKDQNNVVENDETTSVGHDRGETVGNDETVSVGNDQTISIGKNRGETVGANETVKIGGNRSVTIGMNKSETVTVNKTESIGIAKQLTIGGTYTVTVGQAVAENFGASQSTTIVSSHTERVGADQSLSVSGAQSISVSKARQDSVGDDMTLSVGKNLNITAADSISIVTGKASITMKKDGTIMIKGKDITIDGTGAINVKASKNIVMKGKKILQN